MVAPTCDAVISAKNPTGVTGNVFKSHAARSRMRSITGTFKA
jgi:hypothetical protein